MFRGSIKYCCTIFNFKGNFSVFSKIQRLQNKALRTAYGYRCSTPINIMQCEAIESPLRARIAMLSRKYIYKCLAIPNSMVTSQLKDLKLSALAVPHKRRVSTLKKFPLLSYYISLEYTKQAMFQSDRFPGLCMDRQATMYMPEINTSLHKFKRRRNSAIIHTHLLNLIHNDYPNHILIFTDGSVMN